MALCAAPFVLILQRTIGAASLSQLYFFLLTTALFVITSGIKRDATLTIAGVFLVLLGVTAPLKMESFHLAQLACCFVGILFVGAAMKLATEGVVSAALAFVCLAESAFILLEVTGLDLFEVQAELFGIHVHSVSRATGSLGNPNHSGALVAATLPFISPILWPISFLAILATKSTMPAVSAIAAIGAFHAYKNKKFKILLSTLCSIFIAGLTVLFFAPKDSIFSDTGRIETWKAALNYVGLQVWGKGLGFVPREFSQYFVSERGVFYQLHNEWLELYVIGGIVGLALGVYMIIPAFKDKNMPAVNACLVSLLVNSLGNFTFHIAPLFMTFGVCYALQLKESHNGTSSL